MGGDISGLFLPINVSSTGFDIRPEQRLSDLAYIHDYCRSYLLYFPYGCFFLIFILSVLSVYLNYKERPYAKDVYEITSVVSLLLAVSNIIYFMAVV